MTTNRRSRLTALLLAFALLIAACGGTAETAAPGTDAAPTSAASATPAGDFEPSPSDPVAIPTFDIGGLVGNLEDFDSYRVSVATNGEVQYQATVVTKPVLSRDVTLQDGTRIVAIGDEAWMGSGDTLQSVPASMTAGLLSAFDPVLMAGAFASPGALTGADELGPEQKNGVPARHYRIDSGSMVGSLASMPPGSSIDLWIADEGYLTSLAVSGMDTGTGTATGSFTLDVTNVNDPSNSVQRPG